MANSVDTDQTAPRSSLIWFCTVGISHFVRNFGVCFRTFTIPVYAVKGAGWVANNVGPDQTPHSVSSDLGLHCLHRPVFPNT